jgi:hypothetical protein
MTQINRPCVGWIAVVRSSSRAYLVSNQKWRHVKDGIGSTIRTEAIPRPLQNRFFLQSPEPAHLSGSGPRPCRAISTYGNLLSLPRAANAHSGLALLVNWLGWMGMGF